MKRTRQLVIESAVIALLLLGILFGGVLSTSSLPASWIKIQNPNAVQSEYNLTSIALFYSDTLTSLSGYQYQSVSQSLGAFQFLVIPSSLTSTAQSANSEISSMNQSLPLVQLYLNETEFFYHSGAFSNASVALNSFCSAIQNTNASLNQFDGPTTSSFSENGVPVQLYHPPVIVLQNEIASYYQLCLYYTSKLFSSGSSSATILAISSNQTPLSPYGKLWVYTGGELNLTAILEKNNVSVGGQAITIHVEGQGTRPANLTSALTGSVSGSVTIPFFYQQFVDVWATVDANASAGVPSVTSNILNMALLYNQTQIIIGDPPQVLPTFPFTVSGVLKDNSTGAALPNAPVKITSFYSTYLTTTDSRGVFTDTLTVPANATNGLHYIYAAFAPQGVHGPSTNFTSIIVYRLPLNITFNATGLIFPGFPTTLTGTATGNGSALANSHIQLSTPWRNYNVTTDSTGKFSLPLAVPVTEFAFTKQISVTASPPQPFFTSTSTSLVLSLLNLLIVVVIVCVGVFGFYYARNLDIHLPRRNRKEETLVSETPLEEKKSEASHEVLIPSVVRFFLKSRLISSYVEALSLAAKRFGIEFTKSMTIRETIDLVSRADKEGRGASLFSAIALTAEDYLYSKERPDWAIEKAKIIEGVLLKLKILWAK